MFKVIALVLSLTMLASGCSWNSDFRDRKQPEDYLDKSEPIVID